MTDAEGRLNFAKKVLERFLPNYGNFDQVIEKIASESKEEIVKKYNSQKTDFIFGVFSKDQKFVTKDKSVSGKKLVQIISASICKKFQKTVITGDKIYFLNKKGKVDTKTMEIRKIAERIKGEDKKQSMMSFCKILGRIPDCAVFLIDKDRSASIHEEEAFHKNRNKLGLGVILMHKKVKLCRNIAKIHIGTQFSYYECRNKEYKLCLHSKSNCATKKLKISKTSIEPFINKKENMLLFVDEPTNLHRVITHAIEYSNIV